ncbi:MAG: hypothetical protein N3F63_01075 [Thermoplasmata archaeon]|nr:hypothetical protein [Thermoplasmata archaeon]
MTVRAHNHNVDHLGVTRFTKLTTLVVVMLLILGAASTLLVIWLSIQNGSPPERIRIDGNPEDWQDKAMIEQAAANMDFPIERYAVDYDEKYLYFCLRTGSSHQVFESSGDARDTVMLYLDTGVPGYRIDGFQAKYRIEISGTSGYVVSGTISEYAGDGKSWKWVARGSVEARANLGFLEGRIRKADIGNTEPAIYFIAQRADGKSGRSVIPVSCKMQGIEIVQSGVVDKIIAPSQEAEMLRFTASAYGKPTVLHSITVKRLGAYCGMLNFSVSGEGNGEVCKGALEAAMDKVTVPVEKTISPGLPQIFRVVCDVSGIENNSTGLKIESASVEGTVMVYGSPKAVYVGQPGGIIIDGAFGDWTNISSYPDPLNDLTMHPGNLPPNPDIDLVETKRADDGSSIYFYARVAGDRVLAGLTQVYRGHAASSGGGTPTIAEEVDTFDYAYINFTLPSIGREYSIQITGKLGEVISKSVMEKDILSVGWNENYVLSAALRVACADGELEIGMPFGEGTITAYTVEMTNWQGSDTTRLIFVGAPQPVIGSGFLPQYTEIFSGLVEGVWNYENASTLMQWFTPVKDFNSDGIAEVIIARCNNTTNTLYLAAFSGASKISFNTPVVLWGWNQVNNFVKNRDFVFLIDDVNADGVNDFVVSNASVGTTAVRVNIISGRSGTVLYSTNFAARNANFNYSLVKTIDAKLPSQDGIGELLLVMNHSIQQSYFGILTYYDNYLRVQVINPATGNSIWASPLDLGPVRFPMQPINPYSVQISPDVSGNGYPDIFVVSSGVGWTIITLVLNNSEIRVFDTQTKNQVWSRTDLTSGIVADCRIWDFTGDGIKDLALSKAKLDPSGTSYYISLNATEVLYGNNGTKLSMLTLDCTSTFTGLPVNSLYTFSSTIYSILTTTQNFTDFTGDGIADLVCIPLDPGPLLGTPPKTLANITMINPVANTTVWRYETNQTILLGYIYPYDVNGDGIREIYTTPNFLGNRTGVIRMHSGINGNEIWKADASWNDVYWGMFLPHLSVFSDLNADGYPDFVITADLGNQGENRQIQVKAVCGKTGATLFQYLHSVVITPYSGTTPDINTYQCGDISGDARTDVFLQISGRVSVNGYTGYAIALNGTNGELLWYCAKNSSSQENPTMVGTVISGIIAGISQTQCDLNKDGRINDAIVVSADAFFVVYTTQPVGEFATPLLLVCLLSPVPLLGETVNRRRMKKNL